MKRVAHKILLVLLTFAVGVTLTLNWTTPVPTLAYCELAKNAEKYHGREVRVRAFVTGGGEALRLSTHHPECAPSKVLDSVVEMNRAATLKPEFVELRRRLSAPAPEDMFWKAEVVLSGRFHDESGPAHGWLGLRFRISDARIEQVISVSEQRRLMTEEEAWLEAHH